MLANMDRLGPNLCACNCFANGHVDYGRPVCSVTGTTSAGPWTILLICEPCKAALSDSCDAPEPGA